MTKREKHPPFYRLPKALFEDEQYAALSTDAKVLFALLQDRYALSIKNRWFDRLGDAYEIFTVREAEELLHFGHEKVCRLFKELCDVGLIDRKRRGLGQPSVIYLKKYL